MPIPGDFDARAGLGRIEALVLAFGVALLGALTLLLANQSRGLSQFAVCKSNLRKIGTGMELFANAEGDAGAPSNATNAIIPPPRLVRLSTMIQGLQEPRLLFLCPADAEAIQGGPGQPRGLTISYFISDDAVPQSWALLAGDRNLTSHGAGVTSGILEITADSIVGWSEKIHRFRGNVALGDGSVQTKNSAELAEYLRHALGPQSVVIP